MSRSHPEVKLHCLALIADLGVPPDSNILQKIAEAVSGDKMLRAALAAVRVRLCQPQNDDVATLLAVLRKPFGPMKAQLLMVEALAARDELDGEDFNLALRIVAQNEQTKAVVPNLRYVLCLGHGSRGRENLLSHLQQAELVLAREQLAAALSNGLTDDDKLWPQVVKVAEAMVVSEQGSPEARPVGVSLLLQAGDRAKAARKRVAERLFKSKDEREVIIAMHVVTIDGKAVDFLGELATAMKSDNPEVRSSTLLALGMNQVKVNAERDPIPLLLAGLQDSDREVQLAALTATVRQLKWGTGLADVKTAENLIAPLLLFLKREDDARQIKWAAVVLEQLTHGDFQTPGNPPRKDGCLVTDQDEWWTTYANLVKKAAARYALNRQKDVL